MRTAIIIGRKHGQKALQVVSGPEVPILEQKELFKGFQRVHAHDDFEYVELWISDAGRVKERKLITHGRAEELAEARVKAEAELKTRVAAAAKARSEAAANEAKALFEARAKADAKANEHKSRVVESLLKPEVAAARDRAEAEAKAKQDAEAAQAKLDAEARAKAEAVTNQTKSKKHEK